MNPNKCAFGVSAGEFLGFLVHEGGIEVGRESMKAIDEVVPPTNLKELQSLLGKINFVRRFIANLSQKVSVRNMVPTLTSRKRRGLSLNGRC
jgi:hypothetical protein